MEMPWSQAGTMENHQTQELRWYSYLAIEEEDREKWMETHGSTRQSTTFNEINRACLARGLYRSCKTKKVHDNSKKNIQQHSQVYCEDVHREIPAFSVRFIPPVFSIQPVAVAMLNGSGGDKPLGWFGSKLQVTWRMPTEKS